MSPTLASEKRTAFDAGRPPIFVNEIIAWKWQIICAIGVVPNPNSCPETNRFASEWKKNIISFWIVNSNLDLRMFHWIIDACLCKLHWFRRFVFHFLAPGKCELLFIKLEMVHKKNEWSFTASAWTWYAGTASASTSRRVPCEKWTNFVERRTRTGRQKARWWKKNIKKSYCKDVKSTHADSHYINSSLIVCMRAQTPHQP